MSIHALHLLFATSAMTSVHAMLHGNNTLAPIPHNNAAQTKWHMLCSSEGVKHSHDTLMQYAMPLHDCSKFKQC